MAAINTEQWRNHLPNHSIFTKIRENLQPEANGNERSIAKNLAFCFGADFFLWDEAARVFHTTNLRQLNLSDPIDNDGGSYQTLMCINPPFFEVNQVLLSPTRHHVALIGSRGVSVLELPQRWGKKSEFEGGKGVINCRTIPVSERFFTSSPSVSLRQAAWFPTETEEPYLALLMSDNTIRFYSLSSPQTPAKVLSLSQSDDDSSAHQPVRSFAASLGEIAVAFDFGPVCSAPRKLAAHRSKEQPLYPLYVLYENGETYLSYTSQSNGITLSKLVGPLPMYPAAEDNYGYDACAILCLPCEPSILIIATETGTLYHCVVLESEEEEESLEKWIDSSDAVPALYVFECVELELTLKVATGEEEEPQEFDFTCPIRLHRDPLCQSRYHCTHEAGVHSVGLIWINKLQTFLSSGEEDKDSLQELAAEKRCIVEHILCTRPLQTSESAPVRGFVILSDLSLGATLICITSSYECILLPLLSSIRPPSPPLLCSHPGPGLGSSPLRTVADDSFELHIRNILIRSSTNPLVLKAGDKNASPPPQECLQLLSRATQVFREEYILKQDMAREELQKRVKLLTGQKNKQLEELALCREEKKSLREAAERLADKYEDAKYRQETIMNRVKKVLGSLQNQLPILSSSEKDMKKELQSISDQLKNLDNSIKQVNMKMEYQKTQVGKDQAAEKTPVQLNAQQKKVVQDVLKEHGQQIGDMMKQVKDIKNHFSF